MSKEPIKDESKTMETNSKELQKNWSKAIEELIIECKEKEISLLIIDTLSAFWPVEKKNEAAEVEKAINGFKQITKNGIAVMLVHHLRKSLGDEGIAHRGSGAITAATTINIEFKRPEGDPLTSQRVLLSQSRYEETLPQLVIDYKFGAYSFIGTRQEEIKDSKQQGLCLGCDTSRTVERN